MLSILAKAVRGLLTFVIFLGLSFFYSAHAQTIARSKVPYCFMIMGDTTVRTRDGHSFTFEKILSTSGQSTIVQLNPTQILRQFNTPNPALSAKNFIDGYHSMKSLGITSLANIISSGTDWIIQDYVHVQMDLRYFLANADAIKVQSPVLFDSLLLELTRFAMQTIHFERLGDFHSEQLVWNGKTWLLIDWDQDCPLASRISQDTFLNGTEYPTPFVKELLDNLREQIILRRRRQL